MHFPSISNVLTLALVAAPLVAAHGKIAVATGDQGGNGTALGSKQKKIIMITEYTNKIQSRVELSPGQAKTKLLSRILLFFKGRMPLDAAKPMEYVILNFYGDL